MKLDILYSKDRKDEILNVNYVSFFGNFIYYCVDDDPVVHRVNMFSVVGFAINE